MFLMLEQHYSLFGSFFSLFHHTCYCFYSYFYFCHACPFDRVTSVRTSIFISVDYHIYMNHSPFSVLIIFVDWRELSINFIALGFKKCFDLMSFAWRARTHYLDPDLPEIAPWNLWVRTVLVMGMRITIHTLSFQSKGGEELP